ncbi:hypothetical protein [Nocardiopsis sp. NRRL B-16309]|uniref:hypothetical protein n=1 Tax=Nocardiopsis sp. NRRL B-16309 TaxID=1519494 RepID=UPI0006AFF08C|nr:hypothetical protein [Nocardiopsis sp. NRRL B-16309]KOX11835.1 hypothetical protein ADL05_23015 [Nocardiopsis sp. NRRL B-16309]
MKRRITADEVAAHPDWIRALYLQGLRPDVEIERGRRHLLSAGLRHSATDPDEDRYAWIHDKGRARSAGHGWCAMAPTSAPERCPGAGGRRSDGVGFMPRFRPW